MADPAILLMGRGGEPLGRLRTGVLALVAEAEQSARTHHLSKTSALSQTLEHQLETAGFRIDKAGLAAAIERIDAVRRGEPVRAIEVVVSASDRSGTAKRVAEPPKESPLMRPGNQSPVLPFFEMERVFPHDAAKEWYDRLVGLDTHKERLLTELEMLLLPDRLETWSKKHHRQVLALCQRYRSRVPLILLEGDVGTGKTVLAETIGDALARRIGHHKHVHLLKLNTQVRGTGLVGEMSDLIAQAFAQAEARARGLAGQPVLLLIDEADALAASRDTQQMHHEDKAGLNTVLQRLDNIRLTGLPIAVLFITNRPEALDPAVRRRAALDLRFERPDDQVRARIICTAVPELQIDPADLAELVRLTGTADSRSAGVGFTSSDLTDRLLPAALRAAYVHNRPLTIKDLLEQARLMESTPRIGGSNAKR